MKRFWSVLLCFMTISLYAENKIGTTSGDYVIYKDNSFRADTWVGFIYYDENTYGAVLYTPSENRRIGVIFSTKEKNQTLEIIGQKNVGTIDLQNTDDVEAVNYLMTLLPDFYSWSNKTNIFDKANKSKDIVKYESKQISNVSYLGDTVTLNFASYIPIFYIKSIYNTDKKAVFEIEKIGRIRQNGENAFYNFLVPFPKTQKPTLEINSNAKKQTYNVENTNLKLDDQWTQESENLFLLNSYASISVFKIPANIPKELKNMPESSLIKLFSLSNEDTSILQNGLKITGNSKKFSIMAQRYDNISQILFMDFKTCIKNKDNSYTVINLTVKNDEYINHKKYFEGLY